VRDPGQCMFWHDDLPDNVKNIVTRDVAEFSLINTRPRASVQFQQVKRLFSTSYNLLIKKYKIS